MSRLGIFDSGLGGYTIARAIHNAKPSQDIVFLADQKNVPYGTKSNEELVRIVLTNYNWFKSQGITDVLIGCNTSSVLNLQLEGINTYGIVELTARQAVNEKEVIVMATNATVRSHGYAKAIQKESSTVVHEVAMPNLASLIEGLVPKEEIQKELEKQLSEFKDSQIPAVLGCTHYPLVRKMIERYLNGRTYDSIQPVLDCDFYTEGNGSFVCYTTGDAKAFDEKVKALMNEDVESIHVDIDYENSSL